MPTKIKATERILIIGDVHLPAEHPDYLAFVCAVRDDYGCDTHVQIGDLTDWQAASFHESDPTLPSAGDELEMMKHAAKDWVKEFPDLIITEGNHGKIPLRKIRSAGLPDGVLRDPQSLYGVPDSWVFEPNYAWCKLKCGMKVVFQHAFAPSLDSGKKALKSESVVGGHYHSTAGVVWSTDTSFRRFYLATGCGVDPEHPAMAYGKNGIRNIIALGCGVIIDGCAFHIPMWLDKKGRWTGKLP